MNNTDEVVYVDLIFVFPNDCYSIGFMHFIQDCMPYLGSYNARPQQIFIGPMSVDVGIGRMRFEGVSSSMPSFHDSYEFKFRIIAMEGDAIGPGCRSVFLEHRNQFENAEVDGLLKQLDLKEVKFIKERC